MSEVKFEPFQKVLIRNGNGVWNADFFSHYSNEKYHVVTSCGRVTGCEHILPYEGNEHLLGTTNSPTPPEQEFKFGDKVEVRNDKKEDWEQAIFLFRQPCDYPYNVMLPEINGIKSFKYCHHANW